MMFEIDKSVEGFIVISCGGHYRCLSASAIEESNGGCMSSVIPSVQPSVSVVYSINTFFTWCIISVLRDGSIPSMGHLSLYGQLSLAIPLWVGAMSTSQRAVMPCGWGVTAGMVHVWVVGKTVWSHCYTRAISECFRDKGLIIKRYINSSVYFIFLTGGILMNLGHKYSPCEWALLRRCSGSEVKVKAVTLEACISVVQRLTRLF